MGVNLKFPLRSYRKGFFEMNNTTIDAVKEDIKILLLTKKGERVVNPNIGTNIPILLGELFEPIKKEEMEARIGAEIRSALDTWMPYVTMDEIEIFTSDNPPRGTNVNENDILVRMIYTLQNAGGIRDSIQLSFQNAPT
jgi:phage baseplate assembly protein W|tara:strand:+ start:1349 stop:1765 length:417 start_codon:yes stop_codon:yes gene_type:complete